jgi:hypothetical protein
VYGHSVITKSTGRTEKRDENTVWREYVEEPLRSVLLARWNHPDILEIRVQRDESRKRVEEWHDKVWEMLKPALVIDQFDRWELAKPMKRLVLEQDKNANAYTFRDASVIDAEGSVHADFQTYSDQGNLFANMQARDSINGFLAANSSCTGLTVTWIARPDGTPQKDLRTILGVKGANEIILSGHCLGGDVDYVTDQLRSFSKTAS